MARLIIANRHGHQVVEWDSALATEEDRLAVEEAERIIQDARSQGCTISRKVGDRHELDNAPFDPNVEEYQIISPIAGG